ncbi:MAG: prepilin peptidase [Fervidobacterium sp.]
MPAIPRVVIHIVFFVFGTIFGSFSNVLIYRPLAGLKINEPRFSICPNCKNRINWYDNIPLLSFVLLKGKCRYCGTKISVRYPLVEMLYGLVFLMNSMIFSLDGLEKIDKPIAMSLIFLVSFPAFVIDLKVKLLPDYTWITVAVVSLYINLRYYGEFLIIDLAGAGITLLILFLLKLKYKNGIGDGDLFLLPAFAFGCGFAQIPFLLLISSIGGILFSLFKKEKIIPFGPFIILSGYLLLMLRYLNINLFMI